MTHYNKALAAIVAVFILILSLSAMAEPSAPYDMNAPQNLEAGHLYAQSALLIDEDTGEELFSKNSRVRMYPASTTKIMTLLLGLESDIPLDRQVTIPAEAADIMEGSSVIPVKPGDEISWKDLLYSFMLSSGNDGANAIAVLTAGSIPAFVEQMNARAAELGMESTHYANAHGLHDPEHYTTAQDLAVLARAAMQNDVFRDIVAQPNWTITVTRGGETKSAEIISRNSLLQKDEKYYYPDCTGIKTGHHNKAGWCFVGSAERDGMRVICVVLNCEGEFDKWYDAARLFEYGFTRYQDVSAQALLERAAKSFDSGEGRLWQRRRARREGGCVFRNRADRVDARADGTGEPERDPRQRALRRPGRRGSEGAARFKPRRGRAAHRRARRHRSADARGARRDARDGRARAGTRAEKGRVGRRVPGRARRTARAGRRCRGVRRATVASQKGAQASQKAPRERESREAVRKTLRFAAALYKCPRRWYNDCVSDFFRCEVIPCFEA